MADPNELLPTIKDVSDRFTELVSLGLGALPVDLVAVPDATLQTIARAMSDVPYEENGPALMVELAGPRQDSVPVAVVSSAPGDGEYAGFKSRR